MARSVSAWLEFMSRVLASCRSSYAGVNINKKSEQKLDTIKTKNSTSWGEKITNETCRLTKTERKGERDFQTEEGREKRERKTKRLKD